MSEVQTCGRRMGEFGPWDHKEGLDHWGADRWLVDAAAVQAKHDTEDAAGLLRHNEQNAKSGRPPITLEEYRTKHYIRGASNDRWLWSLPVPRTCSFCGSIHPEDALRLMAEGWEVEAAKCYKRYLNPPGYRASMDEWMRYHRGECEKPAAVSCPTPPVKLYVHHMTEDQIRRFNELLAKDVPKGAA